MKDYTGNLIEKLNCRADARWYHPLIAQFVTDELPDMRDVYYPIFDETIPMEERKEKISNLFSSMNFSDLGQDRRIEFTCHPFQDSEENQEITLRGQYVRPENVSPEEKLPCLFYVHMCGQLYSKLELALLEKYSNDFHALVIAVEPRNPFDGDGYYPRPVDDEQGAWVWMINHSDELNIDLDRVAIWGGSSGGLTCLALCHRLKRYAYHGVFPRVCFAYDPVIVDTYSDPAINIDVSISWNGPMSVMANKNYLNGVVPGKLEYPGEAVPQYATARDCVGLPPTAIVTASLDGNYEACFEYALKLEEAGVYVDFHHIAGVDHGSQALVSSGYSSRYDRIFKDIYKFTMNYDCRRLFIWDMLKEEKVRSKLIAKLNGTQDTKEKESFDYQGWGNLIDTVDTSASDSMSKLLAEGLETAKGN